VPLPPPEPATLDDPLPIARWMADTLRAGAVPHLVSFVSPAVLLCRAARAAGIDLRGAVLTVGGEPFTAARQATLRDAGLEVMSGYASTEAGGIATECLAPEGPDDLHVQLDRVALIQPGPAGPAGLPEDALLTTALRPSAPVVLLNASLGDHGRLVERACGCPLERLGWRVHLHGVRSFEKLTAGGMTFHDADVARVLDEVLPARFGGGPTDYQLVEQESLDGRARLVLRVHPAVGPLDPQEGGTAFLDALGRGSGVERVMALQWSQAGLVSVERRPPTTTANGKILHLQADRGAPASS
jgi:phenylacetate-coenzyme A ligase PaaK-like adenylate-forming protein